MVMRLDRKTVVSMMISFFMFRDPSFVKDAQHPFVPTWVSRKVLHPSQRMVDPHPPVESSREVDISCLEAVDQNDYASKVYESGWAAGCRWTPMKVCNSFRTHRRNMVYEVIALHVVEFLYTID